MRILHYIQANGHCADFAEKCKSAQLYCMDGPAEMLYASSFKEFDRLSKTEKPTIVHIHACWSVAAWRITIWCRKHRVPFVISAHRQMEPWHMANNYLLKKLPMMIIFQRKIIAQAKAIHATTTQERNNILNMGYGKNFRNKNPWNKNVVTIQQRSNPIFGNELAGLYNKVIDSNPFIAMNKNEIHVMNVLLLRGLSKDTDMRERQNETEAMTKDMTEFSWRKILLHAHNEGVAELIIKGAKNIYQQNKEIDLNAIDRFEYKSIKNKDSLKNNAPLIKPLRLEEISEEERASEAEIKICTMLLNLLYEIRRGSISRRHLADMYATLRFTDYNEDTVIRMAKRLKIKKFTGRILQIISETLWLEEGFSPMETINDKGTEKIRKKLLKSYI